MSKIVLVPLEMQSVASDFDRKAAELERAAQAVQSPGLVAGLPPGNQATVAAQLRGGDGLERISRRILRQAALESRFWGTVHQRARTLGT